MFFNSLEFALYLPIVFFLYWFVFDYAIKKSHKQLLYQNLFIVVASYIFYGWWNWRFLILIAITSFCLWGSGLLIQNSARSKLFLVSNIVLNMLILGTFKYFNFFVDSFCDLFNLSNNIAIKVVLPVGISFYTFQALSYSIDVYRNKIQPTKDIVAFFAYVSFFPQLVAGPIERATNLLPQFFNKRVFNYEEAVDGMRRILWGLFKKIVVADNCAHYVNAVWSDYANYNASTLAVAAIFFSMQIYGDFSGYSDIAIGTAKLFGINLKDNFLMPYFSRNVAEFWKRWHISLNTWFVDYVYIPLGGSRGSRLKTVRNTFAIFLLSGLWHGANWTYVSWGAYHAMLFVPLIFLGTTKKYTESPTIKQMPQMLLTFFLATIGWIIFRAPNLAVAWDFITHIFDFKSIILDPFPCALELVLIIKLLVALILLLFVEWNGRRQSCAICALKSRNRWFQGFVYFLFVLLIIYLRSTQSVQFIYFQF